MEIDAQSLKDRMSQPNPPVLVDVRNPPEWQAEGIIEGALLIPMNELPARVGELPADRELVTICHVGMRSYNAAMWLRQQGRSVLSLRGGMNAWKASGFPVKR